MTTKTVSSLAAIERTVLEYPYPVAAVYNRYSQIPSDRLGDKHAALCDALESPLRFMAIVVPEEGTTIRTRRRSFWRKLACSMSGSSSPTRRASVISPSSR